MVRGDYLAEVDGLERQVLFGRCVCGASADS